jgi:hypothetical protein
MRAEQVRALIQLLWVGGSLAAVTWLSRELSSEAQGAALAGWLFGMAGGIALGRAIPAARNPDR